MSKNCGCPELKKEDWELRKHDWNNRAFYRTKHLLFLHMPIGIGKAITKGMDGIKAKGYTVKPPYMMLDDETGRFTANMLIAMEEMPAGDPDVMIWEPTTLYSKYYHGPFKGLKKEIDELMGFVEKTEKKQPTRLYTWVTNCPKCWKEQGGPTTIIFARV